MLLELAVRLKLGNSVGKKKYPKLSAVGDD